MSIQGGTYAGNAVSCAAAVAVNKVMQEENTLENVRVRYAKMLPYILSSLLNHIY